MNRRIRIQKHAPQNRELWQKLYYQHPQELPRRRLRALKAVWDGQRLVDVCRTQHVQRKTLEQWLDLYLHGGFPALLAPPRRPRAQTLDPPRKRVLRFIVLHKTPHDYGFDRFQWTAPLIQALLKQKWQVTLSRPRVYEILQ